MSHKTFRDSVRASSNDIPRLALQFARNIAYPRLNIGRYLAQIDELAAAARQLISPLDPILPRATTLSHFLFQEQAFEGNSADYEDPRNSYLNELLDRRLGIPISLSVLYLAVAERVGIPAYGISLPGHFMVGVRDHTQIEDLLFDPFHGGQQVSVADCKVLVSQTAGSAVPFQHNWLLPALSLDIVARMLNNLRLIYVQQQQWDKAIAVTEHLRVVQPKMPQLLRDLGLIYYHNDQLRQAAQYLELYLQADSQASDALAIQQALRDIVKGWAQQN